MKRLTPEQELLKVSKLALSALETPNDLSEEEKGHVIEDLAEAIKRIEPEYFEK